MGVYDDVLVGEYDMYNSPQGLGTVRKSDAQRLLEIEQELNKPTALELKEERLQARMEEKYRKLRKDDNDYGNDGAIISGAKELWNSVASHDYQVAVNVDGKRYNTQNKIFNDETDLTGVWDSYEDSPNGDKTLYYLRRKDGIGEDGTQRYMYKTGIADVSASARYRGQLADNDFEIVAEKRFDAASTVEKEIHGSQAARDARLFDYGRYSSDEALANKRGVAYSSFGAGTSELYDRDILGLDVGTAEGYAANMRASKAKMLADDRAPYVANDTLEFVDAGMAGLQTLVGKGVKLGGTLFSSMVDDDSVTGDGVIESWGKKLMEDANKDWGYNPESLDDAVAQVKTGIREGGIGGVWDIIAGTLKAVPQSVAGSAPEMALYLGSGGTGLYARLAGLAIANTNDELDTREIANGGRKATAEEILAVGTGETVASLLDAGVFRFTVGANVLGLSVKGSPKSVPFSDVLNKMTDAQKFSTAKAISKGLGRSGVAYGAEVGQEVTTELIRGLTETLGTTKYGDDWLAIVNSPEFQNRLQEAGIQGGAGGLGFSAPRSILSTSQEIKIGRKLKAEEQNYRDSGLRSDNKEEALDDAELSDIAVAGLRDAYDTLDAEADAIGKATTREEIVAILVGSSLTGKNDSGGLITGLIEDMSKGMAAKKSIAEVKDVLKEVYDVNRERVVRAVHLQGLKSESLRDASKEGGLADKVAQPTEEQLDVQDAETDRLVAEEAKAARAEASEMSRVELAEKDAADQAELDAVLVDPVEVLTAKRDRAVKELAVYDQVAEFTLARKSKVSKKEQAKFKQKRTKLKYIVAGYEGAKAKLGRQTKAKLAIAKGKAADAVKLGEYEASKEVLIARAAELYRTIENAERAGDKAKARAELAKVDKEIAELVKPKKRTAGEVRADNVASRKAAKVEEEVAEKVEFDTTRLAKLSEQYAIKPTQEKLTKLKEEEIVVGNELIAAEDDVSQTIALDAKAEEISVAIEAMETALEGWDADTQAEYDKLAETKGRADADAAAELEGSRLAKESSRTERKKAPFVKQADAFVASTENEGKLLKPGLVKSMILSITGKVVSGSKKDRLLSLRARLRKLPANTLRLMAGAEYSKAIAEGSGKDGLTALEVQNEIGEVVKEKASGTSTKTYGMFAVGQDGESFTTGVEVISAMQEVYKVSDTLSADIQREADYGNSSKVSDASSPTEAEIAKYGLKRDLDDVNGDIKVIEVAKAHIVGMIGKLGRTEFLELAEGSFASDMGKNEGFAKVLADEKILGRDRDFSKLVTRVIDTRLAKENSVAGKRKFVADVASSAAVLLKADIDSARTIVRELVSSDSITEAQEAAIARKLDKVEVRSVGVHDKASKFVDSAIGSVFEDAIKDRPKTQKELLRKLDTSIKAQLMRSFKIDGSTVEQLNIKKITVDAENVKFERDC